MKWIIKTKVIIRIVGDFVITIVLQFLCPAILVIAGNRLSRTVSVEVLWQRWLSGIKLVDLEKKLLLRRAVKLKLSAS